MIALSMRVSNADKISTFYLFFFYLFIFVLVKFHIFGVIFGFCIKKYIQMSTNKPSIGAVVLKNSFLYFKRIVLTLHLSYGSTTK